LGEMKGVWGERFLQFLKTGGCVNRFHANV